MKFNASNSCCDRVQAGRWEALSLCDHGQRKPQPGRGCSHQTSRNEIPHKPQLQVSGWPYPVDCWASGCAVNVSHLILATKSCLKCDVTFLAGFILSSKPEIKKEMCLLSLL